MLYHFIFNILINVLIKKEIKKKKNEVTCTILKLIHMLNAKTNITNKDGTNRHLWATFKKMPSAYFLPRIILIFVLSDFHLYLWFPCDLPCFSLSKNFSLVEKLFCLCVYLFMNHTHDLQNLALKNMIYTNSIKKIYRKLN